MIPGALTSVGLAIASVALALAIVALFRMATQRRAPPTPRRDHVLTRRAFLALGTLASLMALAAFIERVQRRPIGSPPSTSPASTTRPVRPASAGLWISPDELAALPTDVVAFERLRGMADEPIPVVDVSDQDSAGPTSIMATALVAARLDDAGMRGRVRDAISALIGTEDGSTNDHPERNRPLGIGRNLPGYVIAADLIGLADFDSAAEGRFRSWIDQLRTKRVRGADWSLADDEPQDHSNWGAYISASMTAINLYLGDRRATAVSADIMRGWLGEPDARQDWRFDTNRHDYSWMCHFPDVSRFVPVNPAGCKRDGMVIDGIIPIDMQRGGGFRIPPRHTRYPRESLHGRTIQGELLHRAGFDSFAWGDAGLRRIAERLLALAEDYDPDWYEPDIAAFRIIAARTGASLPVETPALGRSVTGVDWTIA